MKARLLLCLLLAFPVLAWSQKQNHRSLADLAITVTDRSREFAYTNKVSAYFYGETNDTHRRSAWQGFNVYSHEFLNDYLLYVDGTPLPRSAALRTIVRPDYLTREYPGGIAEEIHMVDSLPLFAVRVTAPRPVEIGFVPMFTDLRDTADASVSLEPEGAFLASAKHLQRTPQADYPVWIYCHGTGFLPQKRVTKTREGFSPVILYAGKARQHTLIVAVGDNRDEARAFASAYRTHGSRLEAERRTRMEGLINSSYVITSDVRLNKAIAWAALSLDALLMHQNTKGIFAGLPWFNNYWGRDTFISLAGATLVNGRFSDARNILRSFAAFQQTDSTSSDYGRIPNLVTTTDKAYNTADGTPRFVLMAKEYIERSGDSRFLLEIYPTVLRSIEGTLRYHTDSLGFLTHGDAETWMDAVGPDGPWSPRGNRANDIQALWAGQLETGVWFATRVGDAASAASWQRALWQLLGSFARYFVHDKDIADHLRPDGSRSTELRPNQIFTGNLIPATLRAHVLQTVVDSLTYPYGVASLSQDDPNFHPYHQYPPYYPKDAAYHNGTVWTWLQGPVISELCRVGRQDLALTLVESTAHQILDKGAVGTQSELLDAIPRPGEAEPQLSGTFSQAWNLAEYIRNWYDDILGIRINELGHIVVFHPRVPRSLMPVRSRIAIGDTIVDVKARLDGNTESYVLPGLAFRGYQMWLEVVNKSGIEFEERFAMPVANTIEIRWDGSSLAVKADGKPVVLKPRREIIPVPSRLNFATPRLRPDLRALKGPDYPLIPHSEAKTDNPNARRLVDAEDPAGDDRGPDTYTYPRNSNFVKGCFDIRHLTVTYDSTRAYFALRFSALSDPGWHPEYGFQLTYAVIAIDEDGVPGSGRTDIGHNAKYELEPANACERLIVIGGGVAVEDAGGKTLAAYLPVEADASNPLGDPATATIQFAIPLRYLGEPSAQWKLTVMAGGQDDHGGAGIGEFREVLAETAEWNGGGKPRAGGANVYDILNAAVQR